MSGASRGIVTCTFSRKSLTVFGSAQRLPLARVEATARPQSITPERQRHDVRRARRQTSSSWGRWRLDLTRASPNAPISCSGPTTPIPLIEQIDTSPVAQIPGHALSVFGPGYAPGAQRSRSVVPVVGGEELGELLLGRVTPTEAEGMTGRIGVHAVSFVGFGICCILEESCAEGDDALHLGRSRGSRRGPAAVAREANRAERGPVHVARRRANSPGCR